MESVFWEKENSAFEKGGVEFVYERAKKEYRGSGAYYCSSFGKETICFYKNPYDINEQSGIGKIFMSCNQTCSAREIVKSMLERRMDLAIYPADEEADKLRMDKATGAISKLACLNTNEDADTCILYRTDYINATTFPVERNSIRQIFYDMGSLEVNE